MIVNAAEDDVVVQKIIIKSSSAKDTIADYEPVLFNMKSRCAINLPSAGRVYAKGMYKYLRHLWNDNHSSR